MTGVERAGAETLEDRHFETQYQTSREATLQPKIIQWLKEKHWQTGYFLWQTSRRCRSGFGLSTGFPSTACSINDIPMPAEDECRGAVDGYEFLVMHRYLLQTLRSVWPNLEEQFAGWLQFPPVEAYPAFLQPRLYAWSDAVLRAAEAADTIRASNRDQVLARWKSEGEFGQWLQCGASDGLGVNGLYGALITNGITVSEQGIANKVSPLDLYLFWKAHGWIDQVWDQYRNAVGKTPDDPQLQAALIRQCQRHQFWSGKIAAGLSPTSVPPAANVALYSQGELNPAYTGKLAKIMGEVEEIKPGPGEKQFLKINPHLVGVKPIWISGFAPFAEDAIRAGDRYVFIGDVRTADSLDSSGQLRKFLQSPTLLIVKSIQSPK